MTLFINAIFYILSFVFIWLGSGLIVSSMDRFSKRLKFSRFAISFIILGLLTSIPELGVGLTAIANNDPEIYIGNLIGGIPVMFFFVIPILAIFGRGISLKSELGHGSILATLLVVIVPTLLILDKTVTFVEGIICIILYVILLLFVQRRHGIFDMENTNVLNIKAYSYRDIIKLLVGIGLVFISSNVIVDQTIYFSDILHVSPFLLSLLILSLGTNLPELSIAARSVISGKKDIAFGDYLGSAAVNTLLFGVLTLMNRGQQVTTQNNFLVTFFFIFIGLILFYSFARSKNALSRTEGIFLFLVYIIFVTVESLL